MNAALPGSDGASSSGKSAVVVEQVARARRKGANVPLLLLLLVCMAPVVASYFAYYVLPPGGRTNYGTLIMPQRPLPALALKHLDGRPFDEMQLKGKWTLVTVDGGACDAACSVKLWNMRQVRLATGREKERIARAWFVSDAVPLATMAMREYDGTLILRSSADAMSRFLPLPEQPLDVGARLQDHIWLVDPLGNLMMRWPKAADPTRMKRDLDKLLRASRIG